MVSDAQHTEAHTKSADMDAATVPNDRSNPSASSKRIASENNETNGHQSRSERVKSEGLNHTMIPGHSTNSTQTPNAGAKTVFSPLTLNRTSDQIPQGDSENTNGSTYMQNESIYSVSNMSTALWIASKEAHLGLPMSALKPDFYIGNTSRHSWGAIAGNAMWADYGRTQNTLSLQPIVGLGYQYRLTSKSGITAQLLYSSIKDPGAVYNQTQIYYDYQQLQTTATIRTTRLHYGNLNLAAKYAINTLWSASLGITAAIKITGHNTIERIGFNQLATQQKAMGYVSGFRRLNGGLTAALDRRLNRRTKLGLQYVFGLSDVSNDVEFSETAYHSNSQLNLMLTYTLK